MQIIPADNLACPLDGQPLRQDDRRWLCPDGHSFDIARQGHVNLLPVQQKRSRNPGDSKEMITARGRFLQSGVYAPIAATLGERVITELAETQSARILDAGCGEGYYLEQLMMQLEARPRKGTAALVGLDISKWAVQAAARRSRQIRWLVGSNRTPPLQPESLELILCLFGFPLYESFRRCLSPDGRIILVDPGPEHLIELRRIIYPTLKRRPPPGLEQAEAAGFRLTDSRELQFATAPLGAEQIADLLLMTPHLFRTSREGKAAAEALQQIAVTVDVRFRTLRL
ncbi:putative RNA methyltransferase [Candidatus Endoriftia persephone]|jgi:23S rRNA (guanine745-N1)-methyltransferase|uniref:Ribosomal RNA large subunit methyltransferase A n=3 Tax=Gammaproteobacteria TaxID=1236 RepID=G2FEN1_9GAMM|nr:methyltransferase domain-containing protein [Candidatus Endoriftia persephone]EGW54800.1 ribosomal RNA large subunit methyltransferase A [endosymbiont of Tevnia jerichonana (vent Tica)]USF87314.1 methyltransferase domain-containing protein [Candidatus Endoriftia persephone]